MPPPAKPEQAGIVLAQIVSLSPKKKGGTIMPRTRHNQSANHRQSAPRSKGGRPIWRGMLRISLVTIPVELYPSKVKGGGDVGLTWLHRTCHSRIHYKKVCPIHGEVDKDEIVSGYKYS